MPTQITNIEDYEVMLFSANLNQFYVTLYSYVTHKLALETDPNEFAKLNLTMSNIETILVNWPELDIQTILINYIKALDLVQHLISTEHDNPHTQAISAMMEKVVEFEPSLLKEGFSINSKSARLYPKMKAKL